MTSTDSKKRGGKREGAGRPVLYTREAGARICGMIEAGASKKDAVIRCGFSESAYHKWVRRGRASMAKLEDGETLSEYESDLVDFVHDMEAAMIEDKQTYINNLREAASDRAPLTRSAAVSANKFMLQKRWPDEFGDKIKHDHDVSLKPSMDYGKLSADDLRTLKALRAKASRD